MTVQSDTAVPMVDLPVNPTGHQHPAYTTGPRIMSVIGVTALTDAITHFEFASPDGAPLAPYQPGSHLIITAGEHRNAYSLTGDGINPTTYEISVLRRGEGGGSDWLHDNLRLGMQVEIEGPRSMFPRVWAQRHALLIAGGIGVTPILSHARTIARAGGTADIVYSYRPGAGAHLDELRDLARHTGGELHEATTVEETIAALQERFANQPVGSHAYACGPPSLLETYERLADEAGWVRHRVHLERFTAPEQDPGNPFTVTVASSGAELPVPAGVSLLQALLDAGLDVPNLCRQGVCGECRIPVRSGAIEHRDYVLSDEEKAANDTMMCCVSRGVDIEVDL